MFASPALCHFRKTRTQCLSERTENNHRTLVWIVRFRAGMKHQTFRVCCTQHHIMTTCQPHNALRNRILFDTSRADLFAQYAFIPSPVLFRMYASSFNPSPSFCSNSPQYQLQGGLSIMLPGSSRRFL